MSEATRPARSGKAWTTDEEDTIRQQYKGPSSVTRIARYISRSRGAVVARLVRLGVVSEEQGVLALDAPEQPKSPFRAHTGLMGATEPGQVVTPENMHFLPPGSTVRANDGDWLIHLHDGLWLRIFGCGHCYDREERFHCLLPGYLCHHP